WEGDVKTRLTLNYSGSRAQGAELFSNTLKSQFILDKKGENYNLKLTAKYNFSGTGLKQENLSINGNVKLNYN
ncbi:unnamed protein product, partial [marine sediment metagenome]